MESKRGSRGLQAIARVICIAGAAILFMGGSATYAQGWHFGVGSGFTWMNIRGDEGYNIDKCSGSAKVGHGWASC